MSYVDRILDLYQNRRVFITGHTGFKGAWLAYWLNRIGADVRGYALTAESTGLYAKIDGDRLCDSQINDVRNAAVLENSIKEFQPDYIFHLAAQSLVGESYRSPLKTFDVNVMGTANLLQAARALDGPTSIVVVTTDKVYENKETLSAYDETDRLGGHDPYSASKACAEFVTDSYRKSFFPLSEYSRHKSAVATARSGNVIGGGDWNKNHLMPDIVNALTSNRAIVIRNPSAVRPWQHVLEPLWGYLLLGARLMTDPARYSAAWNFGPKPGDAITVESFVKRTIAEWGAGKYTIDIDENAPHEANLLQLNSTRARTELNWHTAFDVDEAIQIALAWYRDESVQSESASVLVDSDIRRFEEKLNVGTPDDQ